MSNKKRVPYVPWKTVIGWHCLRCGRCCREYLVPLTPGEAMRYIATYGPVVIPYKGKRYLLRKPDGSCFFLTYRSGIAECLIYYDRPLACRLYPFYITTKPLEDFPPEEAEFILPGGRKVYIYLDSSCPGVNTIRNITLIVKEVVKIWLKYKVSKVFKC